MVRKKEGVAILSLLSFFSLLEMKPSTRAKSSTGVSSEFTKYGETTGRASHLFGISFIRNASYPCIVFTHVVTDMIRTCSRIFAFRGALTFNRRADYSVASVVCYFTLMRILQSSSGMHDPSVCYGFPPRDNVIVERH